MKNQFATGATSFKLAVRLGTVLQQIFLAKHDVQLALRNERQQCL
ncbi:hypothetical protein PCI56_22535 [Plesiomonas shigelloides subsp. oncorhynchi]|nr:hypothetical protein [Plesiomonas shigelloides]